MEVPIILIELTILYFLSRSLTQRLYILFLLLFHSQSVAMSLTTLLLFPGTVIHELSHLFTAEILGVRTGKLTLAPEAIREKREIEAGSVAIAQTGPFRKAAIGLAPLVWGLSGYSVISYYFYQQLNSRTVIAVLLVYLLFAVSNSMFPSDKDTQGIAGVGVAIGFLLLVAYFVGFRLSLSVQALEVVTRILAVLMQNTTLVIALNLSLLVIISLCNALLQRKYLK